MTAPFSRAAAIARVGFLMPGLTDLGLRRLLQYAEATAVQLPRDLTPATLAAEQFARHGVPTVAEAMARAEAGTLVAKGPPSCNRCTGDGYPACACDYERR